MTWIMLCVHLLRVNTLMCVCVCVLSCFRHEILNEKV